jgi:hypothetical protein
VVYAGVAVISEASPAISVTYGGCFVVTEATGAVLGHAGLYKLVGVVVSHPCPDVIPWDVLKLGPFCHVSGSALGDCAVMVISTVFAFGPEVRAVNRGFYFICYFAFGYCVQAIT